MSQPFLNMQALQGGSENLRQPESVMDLDSIIAEFTSDIQRMVGQDLGDKYKSLLVSDATIKNKASMTYCLAVLNRHGVVVEVNQGPALKTKFEFRFSDRALMKNGDDVDLDDFYVFQALLNGVLEKVSSGQADVYKEKRG